MNRAMKMPLATPEEGGLEAHRETRRSAGARERRQAVIDVLKDRFARGEIELAEYERRVTAAAEARRAGDLAASLVARSSWPSTSGASPRPRMRRRVADLAALVSDLGRSAVPPNLPEAKQQFVTVMSSRNQRGDWLQADAVVVYALMGSVSLDFTEVRPGDRPVVIEVRSMMGEVSLRVPAGMPVQMDVDTIMSEASVHRSVSGEPVTGHGQSSCAASR